LTASGVLQVVTDPQRADAILTDRIGVNFEQSLEELYAPPKPEAEKREDSTYQRPAMQPLSRGKGNIFLVDRKTHTVIWSTFAEAKSSQASDMTRLADQITERLAKARKGK
jgi:hypothetical protein